MSEVNIQGLHRPTDRRAGKLEALDFEFMTYGHVLPRDMDWQQVFNPHYWENCAHQLRPGDRVEIHSYDHTKQFLMIVLNINHRISPPLLEAGYRAIYPADLDLPRPAEADRARFRVRRMAGQAARYEIFDADRGVVIRDWIDRDSALDRAAALELQAQKEPEAEMPTPAEPEPPERAVRR